MKLLPPCCIAVSCTYCVMFELHALRMDRGHPLIRLWIEPSAICSKESEDRGIDCTESDPD
jgi:hypothetical protein